MSPVTPPSDAEAGAKGGAKGGAQGALSKAQRRKRRRQRKEPMRARACATHKKTNNIYEEIIKQIIITRWISDSCTSKSEDAEAQVLGDQMPGYVADVGPRASSTLGRQERRLRNQTRATFQACGWEADEIDNHEIFRKRPAGKQPSHASQVGHLYT